jgi:hypothetical protein
MVRNFFDPVFRLVLIAATLLLPAAARAQTAQSYLPLAVGNRWELRSPTAPDPMVLEVTGRDGDVHVVRWVNPWVQVVFRLRAEGDAIMLAGLDMGSGNTRMPDGVAYWSFAGREGTRWKSAVGTGEVSDRDVRVVTPAGTYNNAVEVRTIDNKGMSMFWTFAPEVGLVRWGQGRDAYVLSSFRRGGAPATTTTREDTGRTAVPRPAPRPRAGGGGVLIGLDANPHGKNGGGKQGKLNALREAHDAGMSLLHIAPKWGEFEKSGKFQFNADVQAVGEFADTHGLPIALNIRIIDGNQRSMPGEYQKWRFDEERMAERLRAAIRAFPASYKEHTRYLAIGNEADHYFGSRRDEIEPYARLIQRVLPTAQQEFPNAQFTVNFTFDAVGDMGRYRAITDLTEFASFNYYPLNRDFTMRPVSDLRRDVDRMLDAADGKPLYIQEIGYASAERLESSPARQAEFYDTAFDILRERNDRIVGATFLFMSDLSRFIVEYLGVYYRLPNSGNFKAYLQTLGIIEQNGTPKPAWEVFRREAAAMKR